MIIKNGILIEVENKDIPESGIIVIPDNVKAIAQYAFYNATKLEEVIFSEHVCAVGEGAFWKCENLRRVQFSDEVLAIGDYEESNHVHCSPCFFYRVRSWMLENGNKKYR